MSSAIDDTLAEAVLREALDGLTATPKTLSPWLFYDERGSQLFEQITELPEYYPTRTERAIFTRYGASLAAGFTRPITVAELGAGTAAKSGVLLREFVALQGNVLYQPIDVSASALQEAKDSIGVMVPGATVTPQVANYVTDGYTIQRPEGHAVLALYIGSSIGNFSPVDAVGILRNLHGHLERGDALLLGTDLAPGGHKSVDELLAAYDDAAGVTAAFNKNVLARLNREVAADFDLDAFKHRARWNAAESRTEMHLESLHAQRVHIADRTLEFGKGETIHTENSYKFTDAALSALLEGSGFVAERTLHDEERKFAVTLATAV